MSPTSTLGCVGCCGGLVRRASLPAERGKKTLSGIGGKRPFRVRPRVDLGWVLTGFHNGDVGHLWVFQTLVKQILASLLWFALHLFTLHILFVIPLVLLECGDLCLQELCEIIHISIIISILQVASTLRGKRLEALLGAEVSELPIATGSTDNPGLT